MQTVTTSKGQERMQFGTTKNLGNGCQGFSQGQGYFEVGGSCAGRHSFLEAVVCVYLQKKPHSATPHLGARSMPCIQIRTCPLSRRLAGFSTRSLTELPHRKFVPLRDSLLSSLGFACPDLYNAEALCNNKCLFITKIFVCGRVPSSGQEAQLIFFMQYSADETSY